MYEAVHAYPDGESTVARHARTAARYGFEGVVVRANDADPDYDSLRGSLPVDVVDAAAIVAADPGSASGAVGNYRTKRTLVIVRGGTPELNRFAVEQDRVDVLSRPLAREGDVNHVIVREAVDHGVRVEVDLGPVLRRDGGPRVQYLRKLRRLRELIEHFEAPYVVSANPTSHLALRAPRELRAVAAQVGFDPEWVTEGLAEWGRLAARNRERTSESYIRPGVERGRYEEDG